MANVLNRPVKVVHILEATEGGTRTWLENVMSAMDPSAIENACICSLRRDPAFQTSLTEFKKQGLKTWIVDMRREVRPIRDLSALFQIAQILRKNDFDIVHVHSSKAGMLGRIAALTVGVRPVLYTPHAFAFMSESYANFLYRALEKGAKRFTDVLVAVSKSEAEAAIRLGYNPRQVEIIFNGVDFKNINRLPEKENPDQRAVGMMAALRSQKDPLTFIDACALLYVQGRDLRFSLCGSGPLESRVRERIEKRGLTEVFELPGRITHRNSIISGWDVFVLSSRYEGLPYALLEAMAYAKPIVATRVPGIEELITDGETGLIVPPGNPEALATAIARMLDAPQLAARMGAAARKRTRERYSLNEQLEKLTALYERLGRSQYRERKAN